MIASSAKLRKLAHARKIRRCCDPGRPCAAAISWAQCIGSLAMASQQDAQVPEPPVAKHAFHVTRCNIPHLTMGRMSRHNALESDSATLASEPVAVSSSQAGSIIKPLFFKTVFTTIKSLLCSRASFFVLPKSVYFRTTSLIPCFGSSLRRRSS